MPCPSRRSLFYRCSPPPFVFAGKLPAGATLDDIFADYSNSTKNQAAARASLSAIAASYGLKHVAYEAGPGWDVGTQTNLANFIIAQRKLPMKQIVMDDVASWVANGGGEYNHFSLAGLYSRFGQWGHVEHYFNRCGTPELARSYQTCCPLSPCACLSPLPLTRSSRNFAA